MTMAIFGIATPAYKGTHPQPQASPGLLDGLTGYLFGGSGTPAYKTLDGTGAPAQAQAGSSWAVFQGTLSYKTATSVPPAAGLDASVPDEGDGATDPGDGCADGVTQVVIL